MKEDAWLLRAEGVRKRFGATVALDGVDFGLGHGDIHALIGENGAGKSTLMKILAGARRADAGTITIDGRPFAPRSPIDARAAGVGMIHQELSLAPHLSIEQNVMLGHEARALGWIRRRAMREEVRRTLGRLGRSDLSPACRVRDLSPGDQQMVEIARALTLGARILVMDEPTSSLTRQDTKNLFEVMLRLAVDGVGIIYISHFLEEVRQIADRFTVLRDGRTVGTGSVEGTPTETIIEMMIGRRLGELYPRVPHASGEVLLSADRISGEPLPRSATLEVRAGEILGIAGLVGAGRTECLRAIFGLDRMRAGTVLVRGRSVRRVTPGVQLAHGVGLLSEDRKGEGLALGLSLAVNVTLSHLGPISRLGWISFEKRGRTAREWIGRLSIRARGADQRVSELSGGNQQKVALARLLHHDVDVLLLDEPTRGVDVASKVEIYRLVGELAAHGKAIVFVSSYLPELLGVCDRIAVMSRGVLGDARPASDWTEESLLAEATRVGSPGPPGPPGPPHPNPRGARVGDPGRL